MKYVREYKSDTPVGTLHIGADAKNNWYVELKGGNWKPVQISSDPIWIDNRKWGKIPEKFGIDDELWNQLRKEIQQAEDRPIDEDADEGADYTDEIIECAKEIMVRGETISYWMKQYHRNHHGDSDIGLGWLCSWASGQSLTSTGIQPTAHSDDPGMGKTDSSKAAFHCIHTRRDLETSVSAMSLYRDSTLKAGDIISSDDVEWSTALISTVKRAMSNFQCKTYHKTLDSNNEFAEYELPPRLLWWFTSVEASANDQILDRQFPFDVDNSEDHHEAVNDDIKHRRATGELKLGLDDGILTARCMTYLIRQGGPYKVIIPYADFLNWRLPKGHRDFNKFLDMIDALTIIRSVSRERKKESDGAIVLLASIEDYREALMVFSSRQKNIRTHLTNSETRLLIAMTERSDWAQSELVDRTGMKQGTVSKRLSALLEKSNYVKQWNANGEKRYAVTDKVDISIFANEVVSLDAPIGRCFMDIDSDRYSKLFHIYSTLIPISIPIQTNNKRNNDEDLFQKTHTPPRKNKTCDRNIESSVNARNIYSCEGGPKNGINSGNQERGAHFGRNKCGISPEYKGNNGRNISDIFQIISEAERRGEAIRVPELVNQGFAELAICEALDEAKWREGAKAVWTPPSRQERM